MGPDKPGDDTVTERLLSESVGGMVWRRRLRETEQLRHHRLVAALT